MMQLVITSLLILVCVLDIYIFLYIIDLKHKTKVGKFYAFASILLAFQSASYILMIIFNNYIDPYVFEYVAKIGYLFVPATFFIISFIYWLPNINYKKLLPVYILPLITLGFIWTNQYHHLYYIGEFNTTYNSSNLGVIYFWSEIYILMLSLLPIIIISLYAIKGKIELTKKIFTYFNLTLLPILVSLILRLFPNVESYVYIQAIALSFSQILIAIYILEYKITDITTYAASIALDQLLDPFMVIDTNGNIVNCNDAFNQTIGKVHNLYLFDNIFAKYMYTAPETIEKLKKTQKKIENSKKPYTTRYTITLKGKQLIYSVDVSEIKSSNNIQLGFLLYFKDITNHLEHLNTIKEQRTIIFSQDRLATIGKLASSFAQDINTPLKEIENGTEVLRNANLFDDNIDLFGQIESCRKRISDIANNLVSTYTAPTNVENKEAFEVNETLRPIKQIVASELKKYDCTLHISHSEPVYLYGNKTKFSQVITNLVINAIQAYDKQKGGTVYITIIKTKVRVILNIIDNAGGIPDKIKANLFKKVVTTKGAKGTGLGLRLSYSIVVNDFDGSLTFESDKIGTTFSVSIPLATSENIKSEKTIDKKEKS